MTESLIFSIVGTMPDIAFPTLVISRLAKNSKVTNRLRLPKQFQGI